MVNILASFTYDFMFWVMTLSFAMSEKEINRFLKGEHKATVARTKSPIKRNLDKTPNFGGHSSGLITERETQINQLSGLVVVCKP